jgi:hypothetical protein
MCYAVSIGMYLRRFEVSNRFLEPEFKGVTAFRNLGDFTS